MQLPNMAVVAQDSSNGCLAFWSGTRAVPLSALQAVADTIKLRAQPVGARTALRRALDSLSGRDDHIIDVDSTTLVVAHHAVYGSDKELDFVERCRVQFAGGESLHIINAAEGFEPPRIQAAFEAALETYTASDVGVFMSRQAVPSFKGVPLRDRGGVYLVPTSKTKEWTQFADLVRTLGCCECHSIPVAYGDRFARLAVESVTAYVRGELQAIRDAVETGNLGARALQGRLSHDVVGLEQTINAYRDLLGGAADELGKASDDTRQYIEAALIQAEAARLRARASK